MVRTSLAVLAVVALGAGAAVAGPRSPHDRTARALDELIAGPLRGTTTSLYVADAETGEALFAVRPDVRLNPASNVKLIATATALELLGAEHRYRTVLFGPPPDDDGVVRGDVYLLGSYDPTLDLPALEALAGQLVAGGVRRLEGDIVVGEAPARDGLFRGFVDVTVQPTVAGKPATVTVWPHSDLIEVTVRATTSKTRRGRPIKTSSELTVDDRGRRRLRLTVSGQVGRGGPVTKRVWVRERALLAAHLLREALRDEGAAVAGDVHIAPAPDYFGLALHRGVLPAPLAEHRSAPLARIVQRVNKQSTNWLADRIIMTAAARRHGGAPTMKAAIAAMYAWLEKRTGLGRGDLLIDTGSGLSYRTAISSRQLVRIVRAATGLGDADPVHAARRGPRWQAYRESLAVGGRDGTLRHRFVDLEGTVRGKTGTLRNAIALSGLLEVGERRVVFSIITNGHAAWRKAAVRRAQDRMVGALSDYLRGT